MRVTFVSVSDQVGGSETMLLAIVGALRRAHPSWSLHAILPGPGPLRGRLHEAGAKCTVVPFPSPLSRLGESAAVDARWSARASMRMAVQLCRAAASIPSYERALRTAIYTASPDVLHTNGFKAHVLGARTAGGVPVVWHLHEYLTERRVSAQLLRHYARRPAAIVANSSSVADDAAKALRGGTVEVIPNGVDLDLFTPRGPGLDLDRASGLPPAAPGTVRVGLMATFAKWKGHDVFLQALARVPPDCAARGYVIGGPTYATRGSQHAEADLRRRASTLGIADRVGFTGILPAAPALRALDVVVHASTKREPFGLVVAEGMACGRAVIVSRAGGAAEIFEPDVDGLAHTPGDVDGLADCLTRLCGSPDLRARLGGRARMSAERRFDRGAMADALAAVYEKVALTPQRCCA